MVRSRVFVVLAIALFLAGCLCAEAEPAAPPENSKEKAEKDVTELKELTARVLGHAEAKFTRADGTKSTVEDQKTKADSAESEAKKAAQTTTADKRKEEADAVAKKATAELANCVQLYNAAKAKAEGVSDSLKQLVTSASALVEKAKIDIPDATTTPDDYTNVIQSATTVTGETTTLSGQINASTVLADDDSALVQLKDSAKKIEVFKYQAESIAIASRIETALKTAERDIQSIEGKKEEIDAIVQAMKTKYESAPDTSKSSLSSYCTTANSQLQTATTKLQEAQKCNKDMKGRNKQLDATLKTLATLTDTTEEDRAKGEVSNVKGHKYFIDGELQKITAALEEVKNALSSAKDVQQQMQDELSKHNSQSSTKLNEGNPQDNVRTAEVTNPIQNGEAKNPAITETDQTALEKSKDTMDKTSEQPVNTHLDQTKENKSAQLAHNEKQNSKDDNSELLNNDKLRNITKNVTNNPLIGGEVPTRSAANDSAVTVFIPLLVILVISAVLH